MSVDYVNRTLFSLPNFSVNLNHCKLKIVFNKRSTVISFPWSPGVNMGEPAIPRDSLMLVRSRSCCLQRPPFGRKLPEVMGVVTPSRADTIRKGLWRAGICEGGKLLIASPIWWTTLIHPQNTNSKRAVAPAKRRSSVVHLRGCVRHRLTHAGTSSGAQSFLEEALWYSCGNTQKQHWNLLPTSPVIMGSWL